MAIMRLTGPNAAVLKYDALTMMAVVGLAGPQTLQTTMLRLIALVTARYNWARDELTLGQREMARIWSVDERTAKREVRRMIDGELLICLRPGVRGRVASYRLGLAAIARMGAADWPKVGPDFAERLAFAAAPSAQVVTVDFTPRPAPLPGTVEEGWPALLDRMAAEDPNIAAAWLRPMRCEEEGPGLLRLAAPSAFHATYVRTHLLARMERAAERHLGRRLRIELSCAAAV